MTHRDMEHEIRQWESLRASALLAKDWHSLGGILSEDLVHIHANGTVEAKTEYLQTMRTTYDVLRIERPSLQIGFIGEAALMMGPLIQDIRIVQSNTRLTLRAVVTQVWVKKVNGWQLCSFQATRVE
jgi:hypothetical protein